MTKTAPSAPKADRRIQRTRQLLLNALVQLILEKDYEAITVQDIIDRANVGRSTFYAHFEDKEALLMSGGESLHDAFESFRSHGTRVGGPDWNFSLALYQHVEMNRPVFKALLGQRAGNVMLRQIRQQMAATMRNIFAPLYPKKQPPVPLDAFVQYAISSFLGLLTWWLDNDIACSGEELHAYYRRLLEPAVQAVLGKG